MSDLGKTKLVWLTLVAGVLWSLFAVTLASEKPYDPLPQGTSGDEQEKDQQSGDLPKGEEDSGNGEDDKEPVLSEQVVVTANRTEQRLRDVPANVTLLTKEDIQKTAARSTDDVLRQVPGFSLSRQSSSLVASTGTQPAVLRGIGGSSSSRTLVLLDGVPLNDPYGGWVYWTRVPRDRIDRIEVVRGAGSNVWGNLAMAGVINILTERPKDRTLSLSATAGQRDTANLNLFAADVYGRVAVSFDANYYDSDGYPVLRADQRGIVDVSATKQFETYTAKVEYPISKRANFQFTGSYFTEDQQGETAMESGTSRTTAIVAGADVVTGRGNQWQLRLFANDRNSEALRTRIARDRNSETPSSFRTQPSMAIGVSGVWSKEVAGKHQLMAGADYQWIDAEFNEDGDFDVDRFTTSQKIVGKQQLAGVFLQEIFNLSTKWRMTAAGRLDYFRNQQGADSLTDLNTGGQIRDITYQDNSEVFFNPAVGIVFHATQSVSWRAAAYRGFRAPNVDELYRGFASRGGVITEPDPKLSAEQLVGVESGAQFSWNKLDGKVTAFWNRHEDRVSSVTVGEAGPDGEVIEPCGFVEPNGICRQRANIGEMTAKGLEVDIRYRPFTFWSFSLSYMYEQAEFTEAPNQPELRGNRPRHVPENQFVARLGYSNPKSLSLSLQGRFVGDRFEDESNALPVDSLFLVDIVFSRELSSHLELFVAAENLFDEVYEIRRTTSGLVEIGAPRYVYGGLRFRL